MNYQVAIKFDFQQILQLVLQLSERDRQELMNFLQKKTSAPSPIPIVPLRFDNAWKIPFQMKTAKQILDKNYVYKPAPKQEIVGAWHGEESIDTLLALRTK